ncbi:PAS domain-containing protein [Noviherbaspirillum sp. DKR-6]|uniref:histidine kinase n=2 Tax=Noviherbaspirillum pedocola TaxID=2801341 RepID=A0A934W935_9BURK|nr:PAS domain-containing protein [Noviherbaspirillum pedocola]
MVREIGDRKRTEDALRQEIDRNRQIVEAIREGFVLMDRDYRVLRINAEGLRIDGRDASKILGRTHWEAWPGSEHSPLGAAYRWAMTESVPIALEHCYGYNDRELWLDMRAYPSDGGLVVFFRDITRRRHNERAIRESEAKFRGITDAMPQMVWSTRADGHHDYYNRQWYDYTGVPEGTTDGEGWSGMFHPDDQPLAWERWRHSLATGEPYEVHYRLRHRSGQYRWNLGRALPVRDESGAIIRWMGTCTDIHDQKLAEEELKAASRRKDEFLAMLAHELRNPLAPIATAAQLLTLTANDAKRVRQSSDIISRQVRHMTGLVDDLLDVSRVTRGLVSLEMARIDVKPLLAAAIGQARPLIEARRHRLQTGFDAGPAIVLADRVRMIQVIANLLNNAAKYTPPGGEIRLSISLRHAVAEIAVSDNGSGIDAALMPHIFDLFTQAERTPDRSQGGLGLGLALVKSIMALHGGSVAAHSDGPGCGSTFTLSLPLVDEGEAPQDEASGTSESPPLLQPLRLMIVDDNADAADTLAALLRASGHDVTVREDAKSALDAARRDAPQVFILDIGLPDIDGYELARRLRADPGTQNALLIALTGYGQPHDRVLSRTAGFDHHFVKPAEPAELMAALKKGRPQA